MGPTYRRVIDILPEPGRVVAEMQDYPHHFRVTIEHRDGVVTRAWADSFRVPWTTCPLGAAGVSALAGTPVASAADPATWIGSRTSQCLHTLDLTLVALAHVDDPGLRYVIDISPCAGWHRTATLTRNAEPVLTWELSGDEVTAGPQAGLRLTRSGFREWLATCDDPVEREAVAVLRRGCYIAPSRLVDLDDYPVAAAIGIVDSSCHTLQPGVAPTARRVRGSSRKTDEIPLVEHDFRSR